MWSPRFCDECFSADGCGKPRLNEFGTHEQKLKFLKPVLAGEKIIALGVTEPNHGSDVASLETTAAREGDHYVIKGNKYLSPMEPRPI